MTKPIARARAEAERLIEEFFTRTGWRATTSKSVAGALLYTQYGWLVRLVMKRISKKEGGETDTSRDYEYTDWADLARFVDAWVSTTFAESAGQPQVLSSRTRPSESKRT